MSEPGRRTVLWLTNAAAPYRLQVWESLSEAVELEVGLTGGSTGLHRWDRPVESKAVFSCGTVKILWHALRADAVVQGQWEWLPGTLVLLLRSLLRWPNVLFYESTRMSHRFRSGLVPGVRGWIFRRADSVLTVGVESSAAVAAMGVERSRVVTGFNVVDGVGWAEKVRRYREANASYCNAERGHVFVFVGQLIERKRPMALLEAWANARGADDKLVFAGDGPELVALADRVAELDLEQHVTFEGYISADSLAEVFSRAATLALPSENEVWGLVVNEALSSGLHVVVSDRCGVAASVADMAGVFVFDDARDSLEDVLLRSKAEWRGWIDSPEILVFGPDFLAEKALEAISLAVR